MPTKINLGEQTDLDASVDGTNQIIGGVADPVANQDAATKFYVDNQASSLEVQDEDSSVATGVTIINFVGADVESLDTGSKVNVYVPPPAFSSHFNTIDGTSGETSPSDVSFDSRYISDPTSEGNPFKRGAFAAGSLQNTVIDNSLSGVLNYDTNNNTFSIFDDTTTTFTVTVFDADGTTQLVSHAVNESGLGDSSGVLNGNYDQWKQLSGNNAIRIQITDWGTEFFKFAAKAAITVDLTNIISDGGRNTVEIKHVNSTDGTFTYTSSNMFYDNNPSGTNGASLSGVFVSEGGVVSTRHISGVKYYDLNSQFDGTIQDIDGLNAMSYPLTQVEFVGTDYGLPTLSLEGSDLAGWTNSWDNANASYNNSAWAITQSQFYTVTTTANVSARTQDWSAGSYVNSANQSVAIATYTDNTTRIFEDFRDETKRLESDLTTGWIETNDLGSYTGDTDGLQLANSRLVYPTTDYGAYSPDATSQPDYSALTGDRVFYRSFYHDSTSHSNMLIQFGDTNLVESSISNGYFQIEWSLDGTAWFDGNTNYPGGAIGDGDGNRVDSGTYTLDGGTKQMRFTFGTGQFTDASTGDSTNGWGVFTRITLQDSAGGKNLYIGSISFTDWS